MKKFIKKLLHAVAPRLATEVFSARSRAESHRVVKLWGAERINRLLIEHLGRKVVSGPFQGLELVPEVEKEFIGPYLLGTFEAELHPWIEEVASKEFSAYVDVGAKFGYYTVGFAKRQPQTPSVAFDTDYWARGVCRRMKAANGTSNVSVKGFCDRNWIADELPVGSFVLSDCEGYESVLFSEVTSSLQTATLLIETHDHSVPHVSEHLKRTFDSTHSIAEVASGTPRNSPVNLSFLSPSEQAAVLTESRTPQTWLYLKPKRRS